MQQTVKYNGLAIAGFVVSLCSLLYNYLGIVAIVGLVLSVIGKKQISVTGESGRGMATAGIVIGIISLAFTIISIIVLQSFVSNILNDFPFRP